MSAGFAASLSLALVHPWGNLRNVDSNGEILGTSSAASSVSDDLRTMIETKCGDCHSNQTHWPMYSRFAPASWFMEHDVHAARAAMDLSRWSEMPAEDRIAALTRIAAEVRSGQMPPRSYAFMHPASRIADSEKQEIESWARAERKRLRAANEGKETSGQ